MLLYIKLSLEYILFLLFTLILPKNKVEPKTLLLINTGQLGDLIISSIILENEEVLKDFKKIIFLVKDQYLDLFNFYQGKIKIIGYNYLGYKYNLLYRYHLLKKLRKNGIEYSINLTASRGILNDEITLLSSQKYKICLNKGYTYLGQSFGRKFDQFYTKIISQTKTNEYKKHIELLRFLTNNNKLHCHWNRGKLFPTSHRISNGNISNTIIIAPFSSSLTRDWSFNNFRLLIQILNEKFHIILLGSKSQSEKLNKLADGIQNIEAFAGTKRISEVQNLLINAKLFIGLDSGITHLALKVNTPLIGLIGGGNFERFFPYRQTAYSRFLYHQMDCFGCRWNCIHDNMYCLTEVLPSTVIENINEIITLKYS